VFQTKAWLDFIAGTQGARPVLARVLAGDRPVGSFVGLIVSKLGLRILGSPLPGWTTSYMGFSVAPEVSRPELVRALLRYGFDTLRCQHVHVMDRTVSVEDCQSLGLRHRLYRGFEVDLTGSDDGLLARMTSACRTAIRKAEKSGVRVEEARDGDFADEYYAQLGEVFGKQGLVPMYSVERVRELIRHLQPTGMLLLLRARDAHGRCVATGIFPAAHDCMYFWGGASWRAHQHLRPNEALQFHAMRYWRDRGITRYDMGGDGEYKRKYGGREITVPWFWASNPPVITQMMDAARRWYAWRQRFQGQLRGLAARARHVAGLRPHLTGGAE
jgi:hypothetical protein